jgi:endoglucanase
MLLYLLSISAILTFLGSTSAQVVCPGTFHKIDSTIWTNRANPGWNLGNTLDALPTEGSWGNVANFSTFDDLKNGGFKGVRLPGMS